MHNYLIILCVNNVCCLMVFTATIHHSCQTKQKFHVCILFLISTTGLSISILMNNLIFSHSWLFNVDGLFLHFLWQKNLWVARLKFCGYECLTQIDNLANVVYNIKTFMSSNLCLRFVMFNKNVTFLIWFSKERSLYLPTKKVMICHYIEQMIVRKDNIAGSLNPVQNYT